MVEGETHARHEREVGRDVALGYLDEPILHVLRVDELDLIEDPELFEQGSAHQPVEITAGNEATLLGGLCCHWCSAPHDVDVQTWVDSSAPILNCKSSGRSNCVELDAVFTRTGTGLHRPCPQRLM